MTAVRSLAFALGALAWTGALAVVYLPLLVLPRRAFQRLARFWIAGLMAWLRWTCGLTWRVEHRERLPAGAAIIASKHQSAFDTVVFHLLVDDPVFVLKRELLAVPFFGWYLRKAGNIGIDRAAGIRALKQMTADAERALADGSQIIVFPEGTRTPPGTRRPYHPGIAALYSQADRPVVPVALNSGVFWGRRAFRKRRGRITVEILEPVPAGLDRRAFLAELERRIEDATERRVAEAGGMRAAATMAPANGDKIVDKERSGSCESGGQPSRAAER